MQGFTPKNVAQAVRGEPKPQPKPEPRPKPSVTLNVNVGHMVTWAWGRYSEHQKQIAAQESKVLELAAEHFGWLTEGQVIEGLGFSGSAARATLERLEQAELCERFQARHGFPVFVFPQFLPPFRACAYCDSEYIRTEKPKCPHCGAPE